MTPQSEGRYATSLLFTPRPADGRGSGSEYRLQKTSQNATRSPSPEQGAARIPALSVKTAACYSFNHQVQVHEAPMPRLVHLQTQVQSITRCGFSAD